MKCVTLVLAVMLTVQAHSQKISYGFKAGIQENYFTEYYQKEYKVSSSNRGFHAGGVAEIPFSKEFALQPALLLSMKGGGYYDNKIRVFAVELPVNLIYRNRGFFIGGGPGISYGVSGKITGEINHPVTNIYNDKSFLYQERLDFQMNAILGYKLPNNIVVSAHLTSGLKNLTALEDVGSYTNKMKTFALSIGYQLK